ncbi:MAG: sigma-70 family RNA polymerase sigma factor [Kiritimatiellae bacterium]|nr:sigma-70 family RNA polymerase sigma factor [Kiritimatiellia bacterium]
MNKNGGDIVKAMEKKSIQLLSQAQQGDIDAFADLFEELRSMTFAVSCRLVGPTDAEDVVMETYLKAWQALPGFNRRSSLKTWLFRIANNCALDFIRARQRRTKHVVNENDQEPNMIARIPDEKQDAPNTIMERDEIVTMVQNALSKIPEEHSITLQLRYTDGLSYSEIAASTGVSIGTVMSRIFNGKKKLQKIMQS